MKSEIQPQYHQNAKIKCACGKEWKIGSTAAETSVAICGNCHPFYTGTEKIIDTRGRVDKFRKRAEKAKKPVTKKVK